MSLLTELVILVGGVTTNMSRRWGWERQRVNNPQNPGVGRYGGADYPQMSLWNKAGLPASPFRRDNFPMTTAPK
jgi:hypothetical protein